MSELHAEQFVTRDELKMHLQPIQDGLQSIAADVTLVRKSIEGRSWLGVRGRRFVDGVIPLIVASFVSAALAAAIATLVQRPAHIVVQKPVVRQSP